MSTPSVPPHIEEITAPMMFGALWNWTLYGVLVVQLYVYSYNFPGDRMHLKLLVYSVFLVETLQTAFTGVDLYYWFVSGFGNMDHLSSPYLSAFDVPIIGSIVSLTVQLFFVYRIWVLSERTSWFLCLMICISSAVVAVTSFTAGVFIHTINHFAPNQKLKILTSIWLSANALSDILIAGSMLFYLIRRKEDDYFSNHALARAIRLTVETNVLTTTVGIMSLLTVSVFPEKTWYTCPTAILGKLYSNTLFVSLNNRISMREGTVRSPDVTFALTTASRPTLEIVHVEFKRPSTASGERPSEERA
ncbi:hypothetical protein EI94DRAFT_1734164 [Lactarius quietus]|nr:hypothetical protein EI94DRAFT_1734164 [Lactarius quietus]